MSEEVGRSFGVVMSKRGFGLNKCCIIYGWALYGSSKSEYDVFVGYPALPAILLLFFRESRRLVVMYE
jgi:hypothetical protein